MIRICNIQRFSINDGPGIRTTVFFKGCNLRCRWCHNPESISPKKEIQFFADKCINCRSCHGPGNYTFEDAENCPAAALKITGEDKSTEELMEIILKDRKIYETSGGGLTCSGGEPMLQTGELENLLKKAKENGINTAVDTAGNVPYELYEKVTPYTDYFLWDIKAFTSETHKLCTGVDNTLIKENFCKLVKKACLIVRIPVIGGANDSEVPQIADFLNANPPYKVELLPYHNFGQAKYTSLGLDAEDFYTLDYEKMLEYKNLFTAMPVELEMKK